MQALLFELQESQQFMYFYVCDAQNQVTQLFWIHRTTFDLLRLNPEVLIMDATFKTNRFRLPLFNIVGTTLLNTTFFAAFVLTNSRAAEAFTWIFEKLREVYRELELDPPCTLVTDLEGGFVTPIREVFPEASHLLCVWHINEDVKAWALTRLTAMEELNRDTPPEKVSTVVQGKLNDFLAHWSPVMNAPTEAAFDEAWEILTTAYEKTFPAVIVYLNDQWLRAHKRKFVRAWTRHIPHFENTATNRGEKSHDVIKHAMTTHRGHVKYVVDTCAELAKTQVKEYKGRAGDMKGKKPSALQYLPLFQLCHGHVCHKAMLMAYEQLQSVRQAPGPLPMCTGTYRGSLGVPCKHTMQRILFDNQPLNPAEFHAH
jgi:hypothetical protein